MLTIAGGIVLAVFGLIGVYLVVMLAVAAIAKLFGGVENYFRLSEFHRWMRRNYPNSSR